MKQAIGGGRIHGINKAATTNGSHLIYRLVLCVPLWHYKIQLLTIGHPEPLQDGECPFLERDSRCWIIQNEEKHRPITG